MTLVLPTPAASSSTRERSAVQLVRLGDVAEYINGRAFKPSDWSLEGRPIIRIQNLTSAEAPYNYFAGFAEERHQVSAGDLLISWSATLDAFIWTRGPAVLNQHIFKVQEDTRRVRRRFLYFAVKFVMGDIRRQVHGATMHHITKGKFEAVKIPLPTLADQDELVAYLDSAETEASRALNAAAEATMLAERLTGALLREAFVHRTPIAAGAAADDAPAGWTWRRLTGVARLESGHTPSRRHPEWWGGDVPWIALPDIRALDGKLAYETTEYTNELGIANSSARVLPAHTAVMSRTASVGFVTIMGRPMATSQDFVNWVCGPELDPFFLAYALRASRGYIRGLASGAVHKTIYMPTLHSLQVCMPPVEEQRRIVSELDARLAEADRLRTALAARREQIEKLPSAILHAAFTPPAVTGAPPAGAAPDVLPELVHA